MNKFISLSYKLFTIDEDGKALAEEAPAERPFQFISGFGIALDSFESKVADLEAGSDFKFTLTQDEAYGAYEEQRVLDLDREMFCINGHFDHDNIYENAMVPLQNEDGNRLYGRVVEIGDEKVKMDLNHPLAGYDLEFEGHILESREATNEEIQHVINHLHGGGCCCGCDDCGDDCGGHHHHDDGDCGCGCGHCH